MNKLISIIFLSLTLLSGCSLDKASESSYYYIDSYNSGYAVALGLNDQIRDPIVSRTFKYSWEAQRLADQLNKDMAGNTACSTKTCNNDVEK